MVYENDIKLDRYGNSIIENGDFKLTTDDSDFIYFMLITDPGSWEFYPDLGVGFKDFTGRTDIANIMKEMRFRIKTFYNRYNYHPNINIVPLEDTIIALSIDFYNVFLDAPIEVVFTFDLENGQISVPESPITDVVDTTRVSSNKYSKRRTT